MSGTEPALPRAERTPRAAPDPARAARSLTDDVRSRSDDEITALLAARPDLVHPVPADLAALAARATTNVSVARALDTLDVGTLQVLEALAALPEPASVADVVAGMPGTTNGYVTTTVAGLRLLALVWGPDHELRLVRTARAMVGDHPGGLGPALATARRGVAPYAADPALVHRTLADAPEGAGAALHSMVWGPPMGRLADATRAVTPESARTPVEWLLAHHLLEPEDGSTVVLPREVALALRGGVLIREPLPTPPAVGARATHDPGRVDDTAGQQAFWFVRHVADLLAAWSGAPPPVLRSGGLGVRDLARTATILDLDEPATATIVETSYAAGLLGADGDVPERWCPTPAYDTWSTRPMAEQWALLAQAWLTMTRVPALLSVQPRPNLLTRDLDRPRAPLARRAVLAALGALPAGVTPERDQLLAQLDWYGPRRQSTLQSLMYVATLTESEQLGVTGLGALAAPGRALSQAAGSERFGEPAGPGARARSSDPGRGSAALAAAVAPLLPDLLDHVLLQADLTAVAPGPLQHDLAGELALVADVESTGAATVYRFSEASVRRGLDAGRSASDLLDLLRTRSRTPVPQPLEYLVTDVARRHGAVRVGVATSYIRCDDPATVSSLLADRRAGMLGLTRLAETVLISPAAPDIVLARLREAGYAPAAESSDGAVVVRGNQEHRAPSRPLPRVDGEPPPATAALVSAAVRALRAGEHAAAHRPAGLPDGGGGGRLPRTTTTETLALLRQAVAAGQAVWIGYADTTGTTTERVVEPLRLEGGFLTAYDLRTAQVRTFTVARISAVCAVSTSV